MATANDTEALSLMMSVQKMHSRRMKSRAQPPGIKVLSDYDWNNSAEKRKRTGILSLSNVAKILKNFVLSKKSDVKSTKGNVSPSSPDGDSVYIDNRPYEDIVGGIGVVVNNLEERDDIERDIQMNDTLTPEDYGNSYEFFFHINENRKDIMTAINRLGEMLVFYELEGDVDDWAIYVEKMDRETKEWKQRCRRSNVYFEETGRVLGTDEKTPRYKLKKYLSQKADQFADYMRNTFSKAKGACPLLEVICPCTFPSSVERVRSIYSESWHWDEPVPD